MCPKHSQRSSLPPAHPGFIPQAQFIFAKNCSKVWAEALNDFTPWHGEQGSQELSKQDKGEDVEEDHESEPKPEPELEAQGAELGQEAGQVRLRRQWGEGSGSRTCAGWTPGLACQLHSLGACVRAQGLTIAPSLFCPLPSQGFPLFDG